MVETISTIEFQNSFGKFNKTLVVERLPLPKNEGRNKIALFSEIYLLKNYELNDKISIGIHSINPWKELIDDSNKKEDFYSIYRVNTRPRYFKEMTMGNSKTYYDKKIGVNFKFDVLCNYSLKITDPLMFIKKTSIYKNKYSFKDLYAYINNELSSSLLSYIAKSLLEKDISILEFNTYTKEFGLNFKEYANEFIFNESGFEFFDFNFVSLTFVKDDIFVEINKTLYEKADMKLIDYDYKEKSKYSILFKRQKKESKFKPAILKAKEDDES